jgi:hypothetical protein
MANRVQLDTTSSFVGGLNLRADQLKIGDSQSPWLLNMDVDEAFGARSRRGWDLRTGYSADGESVDPRNMYSHTAPNGTETTFLASGGNVYSSSGGGTFARAVNSGGNVSCGAAPHGADFMSWNNEVYVACGGGLPSQVWEEGVWTELADAHDNWANDYTAPGDVRMMPKAEVLAAQHGYLWCANTTEGGTHHANRLRFSHPNDPDKWSLLDSIDFPEGDGPITGIMPLRDHMLVFFAESVWALYGTNSDNFSKANVSETVGAANRQCLTRSEQKVFFVSWPYGVYSVDSNSIQEVSANLRPSMKMSGNFSTDVSLQWLSYVNQKLFWSVPFDRDGAPEAPTSVFTYDPLIGAWSLWRAADGSAIGPVVGSPSSSEPLAAIRPTTTPLGGQSAQFWEFDAKETPVDGPASTFPMVLRTPWVDSGYPTVKKRWRRPDLIIRDSDFPYTLEMYVYHNLDETAARRTLSVSFVPKSSALFWHTDPLWDGTDASLETPEAGTSWDDYTYSVPPSLWGTTAKGSSITRSGGLGNASSVQVEFHGEPGKKWGINALIWKSIMRRIR